MVTTFGQFIRSRRRVLGLSQVQLAAQVGCDQTYISQLEHNRNKRMPAAALVYALTTALETTPAELFRALGYLGTDVSVEPAGNLTLLARILDYTEELDLPEYLKDLLRQDVVYLAQRLREMGTEADASIEG